MLSVDRCRQLLDNGELSDEVVEEVRDVLYQLARIFVENCLIGAQERVASDDGERGSREGGASHS